MPEEKRLQHILGEREAKLVLTHKNSEAEHRLFLLYNTVQRNLLYIILIAVCMVGAGIFSIAYGKHPAAGSVLLVLGILPPPLLMTGAYVSAKRYIKKNSWYLDFTSTYKFYEDLLYIKSDNGKKYSESVSNYENLYRVCETGWNIYIYLSKVRVLIIEKRKMSREERELFWKIIGSGVPRRKVRTGFFGIVRKFKKK